MALSRAFLGRGISLGHRLLDLRLQFAATLLLRLSPRPSVDRPGSRPRVGGLLLVHRLHETIFDWSLAELMDLAI